MSFVHLHNHSYYSLLDGLSSPTDLVNKAKEQGANAVAITDHGTMYGCLDFYKVAKWAGIKPILGVEAYLTKDRFDKKNREMNHLVLLAYNKKGYQNLLKITTAAHLEGFYYKPRIDFDLLETYKGGIIALSGCFKGEVPQAIVNGEDDEKILEIIKKYEDFFGKDNFYLEIQDHPDFAEQNIINFKIVELNQKYWFPIVITTDSHFIEKEDGVAQDVLLCINQGKKLSDTNRLQMGAEDCSLRSPEYLKEVFCNMLQTKFPNYLEIVETAMNNTQKIADKCQIEIEFNQNLIPSFKIEDQYFLDDFSKKVQNENYQMDEIEMFFRYLCVKWLNNRYEEFKLSEEDILILIAKKNDQGLTRKLTETDPAEIKELMLKSYTFQKEELLKKFSAKQIEIIERLEYELRVILEMGFNEYFLIVWDFINWSKEQGIMVGPGRWSAAGAIVAYLTGITDIDPLIYSLLFERFLNPARVSMPDIDVDFADNRRDEVISYCTKKYWSDKVAQVCTYGTIAAKQSVKDTGRVLGESFADMNILAKILSDKPGTKLKNELSNNNELIRFLEKNEEKKKIFDIALKLEGVVRQIGVHACAVLISDKPLVNYTALQYPPKEGETVITQYNGKMLESLGLLKMDFLGLKNLSVIQTALKIIERTKNEKIDIKKVLLDDSKVYETFASGDTTGIFQFESEGMRKYLQDLKPSTFEDIIAMVSLYRPGPLQFIPIFVGYKHNQKINFPDKEMEKTFIRWNKILEKNKELGEVMKPTYSVAVYQEQILQIAQIYAWFSLGRADLLRRAIGKKIYEEMIKQKDIFIKKGAERGGTEEEARFIFEKIIEPFAQYGFNKSHAACYALISYRTAYLKTHYFAEYLTALMTIDSKNTDRVVLEIGECEKHEVVVAPPNVNESLKQFTFVTDQKISFGLEAIKGLGEWPISLILKARENNKFKSLTDFLTRVDQSIINKKTLEALVKSGSFDDFGERNSLLHSIETMIEYGKKMKFKKESGQSDLFDLMSAGDVFEKNNIIENDFILKEVPVLTEKQKLEWEKEVTGMFISGSPLKKIREFLIKNTTAICKLDKEYIGDSITVGGILVEKREIITQKGDKMAFSKLDDETGLIDLTFFPRVYEVYKSLVEKDNVVLIKGKVEERNEALQILVNDIKTLDLDKTIAKDKELQENGSSRIIKISLKDKIGKKRLSEIKKIIEQNKIKTNNLKEDLENNLDKNINKNNYREDNNIKEGFQLFLKFQNKSIQVPGYFEKRVEKEIKKIINRK